MKISEIKTILKKAVQIQFEPSDGELVPRYFHVTEVGKVTKHLIE